MGGRGVAGGGYTAGMKTSVYNKIISMGGSRWKAGERDRVYFNSAVEKVIGLSVETYKSGSVRYAELNGVKISNSQANRILRVTEGMYFDAKTKRINYRMGAEEYASRMREFIDKGK